MNIYFATRTMDIIGMGSTNKIGGILIEDDTFEEDVESGTSTLTFTIHYNKTNRLKIKEMCAEGNYLLRDYNDSKGFFTIIESELNNTANTVSVYAEDAGLDLLNEVVGDVINTSYRKIEWYINQTIQTSGFKIDINEIPDETELLVFSGNSTVIERLQAIADAFDVELEFDFDIKQLDVIKKYINIYKKRGKDINQQLRMGQEIASIREKRTVANLVTALEVRGGTPDGASAPITLRNVSYDDGDIYINQTTGRVCSRDALEKWTRYLVDPGDAAVFDGNIVGRYSYDTTDKTVLKDKAIAELKRLREPEVNYDVELHYLPKNLKVGDRVNIVDDAGELYLSARILKLIVRASRNVHDAVFGEYLIKDSGISQKLIDLAEKFSTEFNTGQRYTWIAYADDVEGGGISLDPEGKEYIGISANHLSSEPDLTDPSAYTWSKYVGEDGKDGLDGVTLTITSSNGTTFQKTYINTTLTAHVYSGGKELNSTEIAALGTIKWYSITSTGKRQLATGITYTINASQSYKALNIIAELEGV